MSTPASSTTPKPIPTVTPVFAKRQLDTYTKWRYHTYQTDRDKVLGRQTYWAGIYSADANMDGELIDASISGRCTEGGFGVAANFGSLDNIPDDLIHNSAESIWRIDDGPPVTGYAKVSNYGTAGLFLRDQQAVSFARTLITGKMFLIQIEAWLKNVSKVSSPNFRSTNILARSIRFVGYSRIVDTRSARAPRSCRCLSPRKTDGHA